MGNFEPVEVANVGAASSRDRGKMLSLIDQVADSVSMKLENSSYCDVIPNFANRLRL